MRTVSIRAIALLSLLLSACGGREVAVAVPTPEVAPDTADAAIAVVRHSFDAMGGLDRLRLAGGKVQIAAVATVDGKELPVTITFGGPGRYRIDYVSEQISYVHFDGACRKVVYGVSVKCAPEEERWFVPLKILVGLTFPSADAAQLGANLRLLDDATFDGRACAIVELRPEGTSAKLRAAYDKETGLLAQISFELKDDAEHKTKWTVKYGDYREVKKMRLPHMRSVSLEGTELWRDEARTVDFDGFDVRVFDPPLPPTMEEPLPASLPSRRFVREKMAGVEIELPAPAPTPGGAWISEGTVLEAAPAEIMRIVHKGPIEDAAKLVDKLKTGAAGAGKKPVGKPGIILLERPAKPEAPVLFILYVAVVQEQVEVKITL